MCQHCNESNQSPLPIPGIYGINDLPPVVHHPDERNGQVETSSGEWIPEDEAVSCEHCGNVHHVDADEVLSARHDGYEYRHRGESLRCENCRVQCPDCDEWFTSMQGGTNTDDRRICQSCSENYTSCESCDCVIHNNDARYDDVDEQTLCASCMNERERARERQSEESEAESAPESTDSRYIQNYTYKPRAQFFKSPNEKSKLPDFAGLEIEVDYKGRDNRDKNTIFHDAAIEKSGLNTGSLFYLKSDGSLDDGFEIVSHPATYRYWMEYDFKFAKSLRADNYRAYDTNTCGLHIHFTKSALTESQRAKLLMFARDNPKFLFYISRRKDLGRLNGYSPIKDTHTAHLREIARSGISEKEWAIHRKTEEYRARIAAGYRESAMRHEWEHKQRYTAINCTNEKTIEFRFFRGTLNPKSIKRNIAFVFALVAYVQSAGHGKLSTLAFCKWIESEGLRHVGGKMSRELVAWIDAYLDGQSRPEHDSESEAA